MHPHIRNLPTWKTLTIGTGLKTAAEFRAALKGKEKKMTHWCQKNFDAAEFGEHTARDIDLVLVNSETFGLAICDQNSTDCNEDLFLRAQDWGLKECTSEVGPQLLIQYPEEQWAESLFIGMKRFSGVWMGRQAPMIFSIVGGFNDFDAQRLNVSPFPPKGKLIRSDMQFVYIRPR